MRPLAFAVILLSAANSAGAQSRVGVVEAGASNPASPAGSLTSTLNGGAAPQLVPLGLAAPSLSASPGFAPAALAPSPIVAGAPYAAPALALPVSFISPARQAELKPAPAPLAKTRAVVGGTSAEPVKTPIGELIALTKRLFGETSGDGKDSAEYLKPDAPFAFGAPEASRYREALGIPRAKTGEKEVSNLVSAAEALAKSAGIAVERSERAGRDEALRPVLRVTPSRDGHRLNRLAWDLSRTFESDVEYAPHRTNGGVAAYNAAEKVLFLPDFGREDAFEAVLHESRHAAFAKRLRRGDLSVFHVALIAYEGRSIAPNAQSYAAYMSLEEISAHAKTLLHAVLRAQRGGASAVADAKKYADQLSDVLRSADTNLFQLQRRLEKGELRSYAVSGVTWPEIPGGRWEAINLPHAILVIPVFDEAPAPPRSLWNRVFKGAPETGAMRAARRYVDALRPLVSDLSGELEIFIGAMRQSKPDLRAARAAAARMTVLADKADKRFAASR